MWGLQTGKEQWTQERINSFGRSVALPRVLVTSITKPTKYNQIMDAVAD